jgi:hypothetical protein
MTNRAGRERVPGEVHGTLTERWGQEDVARMAKEDTPSDPKQWLGPVWFHMLKFNFHHINIAVNIWSTECRVIVCMSAQIRSNLRDESIKPN